MGEGIGSVRDRRPEVESGRLVEDAYTLGLRGTVARDPLIHEVNGRPAEEAEGWRRRFQAALDENAAALERA